MCLRSPELEKGSQGSNRQTDGPICASGGVLAVLARGLPIDNRLTKESMNNSQHQVVMKIQDRIALQLVRSSPGRIILHLTCLARDHRFRWHWQGILREL